MRKILIAVCDTDGSYGQKLGEWISLQRGEQIMSVSFSSPEHFLEYHDAHTQDIVLLGKGFYDHPQVCEKILEKTGKTLWLYLHDGEEYASVPDSIRRLPSVEKYQSAQGILREVFSFYQECGSFVPQETGGEKEMIGIYSPGHSIWQTPFALTYAQALAQKEKVLYLNFQECAGFQGWFREEYERDLLDVMYLCLSNEAEAANCISGARYSMEGIDYIPPAKDGVCLGEISSEDYIRFVRLLAKSSGYHIILLDFGMMVPGFFQLLGVCSKIYIVSEAGELPQAPLQQFQQMAKRQEDAQLNQKLKYLSLPPINPGACPGAGKMQQWLWGTMGDFSRRLSGVSRGTD